MSELDRLAAAQHDAQDPPAPPIDGTTQACGVHDGVVEVEVVDDDDQPLQGVVVELCDGDARSTASRTASDGRVRFEGLSAGGYTVVLSELDQDAWVSRGTITLPSERAHGGGSITWGAVGKPRPGRTHTIVQGECAAKLAERHGMLLATVWDHPDNAELRERNGTPYVLAPGDVLALPPHHRRSVEVHTGSRLRACRRSAYEVLKLRFVDVDGTPERDRGYLAELEVQGGTPLPFVTGSTDADGALCLAVPPSIVRVAIHLDTDDDGPELYVIEVGHLDPIQTPTGVADRLSNLGLPTDDPVQLERALAFLQREHQLDETGALDSATCRALEQHHDF